MVIRSVNKERMNSVVGYTCGTVAPTLNIKIGIAMGVVESRYAMIGKIPTRIFSITLAPHLHENILLNESTLTGIMNPATFAGQPKKSKRTICIRIGKLNSKARQKT